VLDPRLSGISDKFAEGSCDDDQEEEQDKEVQDFLLDPDLEIQDGTTIIAAMISDPQDPDSRGIRYSEQTREWAFEFLRTCRTKALTIARDIVPLLLAKASISNRRPITSGLT
jgi:hypothetical protein